MPGAIHYSCSQSIAHMGIPGRHKGLRVMHAGCSPDAMLRDVQRCPSVRCLMDLKDCLDFCSTSWVSLFCQLGGAELLLQVFFLWCPASWKKPRIKNEASIHAKQCTALLIISMGMDRA